MDAPRERTKVAPLDIRMYPENGERQGAETHPNMMTFEMLSVRHITLAEDDREHQCTVLEHLTI